MKPTKTSHVIRKIFRELGADVKVDPAGFLVDKIPFPRTTMKTNEFAKAYFIYNIARKREVNDSEPPSTEQMRNALTKWTESERRCQILNDLGMYFSPINETRDVFSRLQQLTTCYLSSLLCDVWPDLSSLNHTSGSTSTMPKRFSWSSNKYEGTPPVHLQDKFTSSVTCVPAAQDFLTEMLICNPGIARRYERVRWKFHSTFDTPFPDERGLEQHCADLAAWLCQAEPCGTLKHVNKNIDEVRLIAPSSGLTIAVQKTVGDAIRGALKRVGIDLNDQRVNQEWAEIGSYTGLVATVDLSAASDSISLRMLQYFPRRWQEYFTCLRDTHVKATENGPRRQLAMIAGMGNGFIFELESALFWAFSMAVTSYLNLDTSCVSVYGDDIIIPTQATELLRDFLLYNGFLLNEEKSFWGRDPFRESCGKHYHNGVDVTPVYIKGDLDNVGDLYHLTNGLCEWSYRTGIPLWESIDNIVSAVKPSARHVIPRTWSSREGFHYALDETFLLPKERWNRKLQCYETRYTALVVPPRDMTARCGETHRVVAALQLLEDSDIVIDLDPRTVNPRICRAFKLYGPLYEVPKARITWTGDTEQKQQRSESFVRDASGYREK